MIDIRGVMFGYNGSDEVLHGIDVNISRGDMLGILGPNGSGKSTLLGIMNGALRPRKGIVNLEGKELGKWSRKEIARRIAVVPQESSLSFQYTVEEVVSMGRYPHMGRFSFTDRGGREIVERSMENTEIMDLREKTVDRLSGGERQRVMIARALAQEPEILMLDEPTKNLDIRHSLDILNLIEGWNKDRGLTVVAVLHDLELAARYCRSFIMLKEGRVVEEGGGESVLRTSTIKSVFGVDAEISKRGSVIRIDILE